MQEGQTGTAPDGTRVIVRGGKIVPLTAIPQGTTARPEYGPNAYQTADGSIVAQTAKGGIQLLQGADRASAEARTRIGLGLGPAIEAQQKMFATEGWDAKPGATGVDRLGSNPFNSGRGALARLVDGSETGGPVAKALGGQKYQDYEQASRTFESALLPIFSGSAVTDSEAKRFIRANLPQMGDSPQTLASKAKNRAMILNAAAKMSGKPLPFPRIGVWGDAPDRRPQSKPPAQSDGWKVLSVE